MKPSPDPCIKETGLQRIDRLSNDLLAWGAVACDNDIAVLMAVMGTTLTRIFRSNPDCERAGALFVHILAETLDLKDYRQ
jgi:hypothetical protein